MLPRPSRSQPRRATTPFAKGSGRATVAAHRGGSTLTEVLVALLIMSIGLVSLATLFPLATLRAAKAVQMTAATDLRYNAEAVLKLYPEIISDPDLDLNQTTKNVPSDLNLSNEPTPGYALWVIDPIGWTANGLPAPARKDANNNVYADFFGQDSANNNLAWTRVQRFSFNRRTESLADAFATLPDNSTALLEARSVSPEKFPNNVSGSTRAVVPGVKNSGLVVDANGVPIPAARIVFFSADSRTSQVRPITKVDVVNETVFWTEDLDGDGALDNGEDYDGNGGLDIRALPANSSFVSARIESVDQRYTYLLTVRKTEAGLAEIDVVVFFKRQAFSDSSDPRSDERLFVVQGTDPISGKPIGFVANSPTITVKYTAPFKPALRKGGFVFDAGNARWYRVVNINSVNDAAGEAVLTIDPPAVQSSPRDNNGNLVGNRAMFPRGIVEVFPLGTKP